MIRSKVKLPGEIPIGVSLVGDIPRCYQYIGLAKSQLDILERQLSFQEINVGARSVKPFSGVTIKAWTCFNYRKVSIYVDPLEDVPEKPKDKPKKRECFCNCSFSVGKVLSVSDDTIDDAPLYDVVACNGSGEDSDYYIFTNTLATDFTKYLEGDTVILIPYNENLFSCCTETVWPTGCNPKRSEYDTSNDEWRTTYRIAPWSGAIIPQWRYIND